MIPMEVTRTIDMTWLEYHRLCEMLYAEQVHYYDDSPGSLARGRRGLVGGLVR